MREELPERFSTRRGYLSFIDGHIRPFWERHLLSEIRPHPVERWLQSLPLSPKSKANIRGILHLMCECASRWEWLPLETNPISLVRVPGATKRQRLPRVLSITQIQQLALAVDREPYVTMIWTAACLGLAASEIAGLKWQDIDFENCEVRVRRGVVAGRVGEVKTIYRAVPLPLAAGLATKLGVWRTRSKFKDPEHWVFANPHNHGRPINLWNAQTLRLRPAAQRLGLEDVGWHALRHSYSTLLRRMNVDLKVHQALLRHADVRTTLQIYTQAASEEMREANARLVSQMLPKDTAMEPSRRKPPRSETASKSSSESTARRRSQKQRRP